MISGRFGVVGVDVGADLREGPVDLPLVFQVQDDLGSDCPGLEHSTARPSLRLVEGAHAGGSPLRHNSRSPWPVLQDQSRSAARCPELGHGAEPVFRSMSPALLARWPPAAMAPRGVRTTVGFDRGVRVGRALGRSGMYWSMTVEAWARPSTSQDPEDEPADHGRRLAVIETARDGQDAIDGFEDGASYGRRGPSLFAILMAFAPRDQPGHAPTAAGEAWHRGRFRRMGDGAAEAHKSPPRSKPIGWVPLRRTQPVRRSSPIATLCRRAPRNRG